MKRVISAVAVAGIGLWSASVFAQGRNFGGSWTLDQEKTMAAAMSELQTATGGAVARGGGAGGGGGARSGGGGGGFGATATAGAAPVARSGGGGGGGMGGGRGRGGAAGPISISLDSNAFTVGSGETSQIYRLDGTPTVTETAMGRSTSKASWKDDKLVVETTNDTPNGAVSSTIVWYLEGDSLVRETHSNAGGQDVVRKTFYKRAS